MKKNKLKILLVLFVVMISLTGCTKILKNDEKKVVQNTVTGQNLVENILCKPKDEKTLNLYKIMLMLTH